MASTNTILGINLANTAVQGAFQIATMSITYSAKMRELNHKMDLAEKHYHHMAEIISLKEETSGLVKDAKIATLAKIEDLAEVEKQHAIAKERYTQAKVTKQRFKMKTGKLRELISRKRFYGKPVQM